MKTKEEHRLRKVQLIESIGAAIAGERGISQGKLDKVIELFDIYLDEYKSQSISELEKMFSDEVLKEHFTEIIPTTSLGKQPYLDQRGFENSQWMRDKIFEQLKNKTQ